jgi:hypothetical protein
MKYMRELEVIKLIRTTILRRGEGLSKDDPIRVITQYWDMQGNLVAEYDPCAKDLCRIITEHF